MESKKKVKKSRLIYISIVVVLLLLQLIAWNSRSFSDAYIAYIFPIWVNTYGRITGSFPFSVGEWMIVAGIAVVILAVLLGMSMIFPGCRHSAKYCRGVKRYFRFFAWVLLFVFAIMTLNCTMIYHGSTFSEKYFGEEEGQQDVTLQERTEELLRIYNDIVSHCNALCMEMERDDSGAVVEQHESVPVRQVISEETSAKVREKLCPAGWLLSETEGYVFLGFYVSDVYVRVLFSVFHGSKL